MKGIILYFHTKEGKPLYIYKPLDLVHPEDVSEWVEENIDLLKDLCHTMKFGSLCALGGFAPYPVESALRHFPEDFHKPALEAAAE